MDTIHAKDVIRRLQIAAARLELFVFESLGPIAGGLTATQVMVLYRVGVYGAMTAGVLQSRCYKGTNPSYNIRKLVDGGFLRYSKSKKDRRKVHLSLTEKGKNIYEAAKPVVEDTEKHLGEKFSLTTMQEMVYHTGMMAYQATMPEPPAARRNGRLRAAAAAPA